MKYMGSKARVAKQIIPIILKDASEFQYYVEPFCGGCNLIDKVPDGLIKIASDSNVYLIAMWRALQSGWEPPCQISKELYDECRQKSYNEDFSEAYITGYIGFNGSYGGRFYDGGYAGITYTKEGKERNYPLEAYRNIKKQVNNINDIKFECSYYEHLEIPNKSIIYCDPPYQGTKQYLNAKDFNHSEFWEWCRTQSKLGNKVFVSEYNAPDDFTCVWEQAVKSSLSANGQIGGNKNSVERLFTLL